MDMHPWTKYDVAAGCDAERQARALAAYHALRGADGGMADIAAESRSARIRLLDRLLRREIGVARPARPVV
jgi:hypothetical protein